MCTFAGCCVGGCGVPIRKMEKASDVRPCRHLKPYSFRIDGLLHVAVNIGLKLTLSSAEGFAASAARVERRPRGSTRSLED